MNVRICEYFMMVTRLGCDKYVQASKGGSKQAFLIEEAAPFSCTIACRQERMLCQKEGERLYEMHSNQHRPLTPSTLRIQCLTLWLAELICGPVQQGCFIAHLRIQLSAAMLIIDAAFCDFEG